LVDLWNRGLPERGVVRPLSVHEFDTLIMGKLGFEAAGLIVGERDGRICGFAHAGFGPVQPQGPSHGLDHQMGVVAMLVLEPGLDDVELERGLLHAAEQYLRARGASVCYAGGQYPLNPFYWGLYGGSEYAGILGTHAAFHRAAARSGYQPVATTVLLEADLSRGELRDPKMAMLRRQVRFEMVEDVLPNGWWEALAIGLFRPTRLTLFNRADERIIGRATTWDIASGFGVGDGRPRLGLVNLEIEPDFRRRGFGRLLVSEVFRYAREQFAEIVCVQTSESNTAALELYQVLGFEPVDTSVLYRLAGEGGSRDLGGPSAGETGT
jgi:ribosomal protein S18 acetylase RimI-like enzyme